MIFTIICVVHGDKLEFRTTEDPALLSNPPMNEQGMIQIQSLIPKIQELGPFDLAFSSRLCRGNDATSTICMALNMDWQTNRRLGQHASLQNGVSYHYPGCEGESYQFWQNNVVEFVRKDLQPPNLIQVIKGGVKVFIGTHRPVVAGLIGWARKITDPEVLKTWARDPRTWTNPIHIFTYNPEIEEFKYLNDQEL